MADPSTGILGHDTSSAAGDAGTLCRTVAAPPGPIGTTAYQASSLSVRVVSAYVKSEGVDHELVVRDADGTVVHREVVCGAAAASERTVHSARPLTGTYTVEIVPFPPAGQELGPVELSDAFRETVTLDQQTQTAITFEIKRKSAILHNIPVRFHVKENDKADGSEPLIEWAAMSDVAEHSQLIEEEAKRQGVDPDLVKAIMYMETTHGYYDAIPALWDGNKSLLPMNVNVVYWSELPYTRAELKEPKKNIEAGVFMLKRLAERASPRNVRTIATLYNSVGEDTVTNYGARVEQIYLTKPWIPQPSILDQINETIRGFESASPLEKVRMLERMFGG